jgi:uncharacterized protein (TIGR02246 family)
VESQDVKQLEATFAALSAAWKNGDGEAFVEWCTDDVDFINLLGIYTKGSRAVAALHEKIFRGPYRDSSVTFTIERLRPITKDAVIAIVPSRIDAPSGPVQGIVLSIATVLLVRDSGVWKVANFHNTRREATQADHLSIMRKAVED